jgi:hypothetical protein
MPSKPSAQPFPGGVIKRNSPHSAAVSAIQQRLNVLGIANLPVNGLFDAATESAVKRFQALFNDLNGMPLRVDGEVGELSWGALFGAAALPPIGAGGRLAKAALDIAVADIGVLEEPLGSNAGPRVNEYLASVGLGGGFFWCAAFVFFCAREGAKKIGVPNPLPRTAGVLDMWRKAGTAGLPRVTAAQASAQPALVTAGMIFIMDFGGGAGHTGYVRARDGGRLVTVEGNSNNDGSRNGTGVFELRRRGLSGGGMTGFIGLP